MQNHLMVFVVCLLVGVIGAFVIGLNVGLRWKSKSKR